MSDFWQPVSLCIATRSLDFTSCEQPARYPCEKPVSRKVVSVRFSVRGHILLISSKISKSLAALSRYRSLILPYITYGIAVWGRAAQTNLETLLILKKRALHFIHSYSTKYNILPPNFQYCRTLCITMTANISNLFLYPTQIAIILRFQRLVVSTLHIPGQIS